MAASAVAGGEFGDRVHERHDGYGAEAESDDGDADDPDPVIAAALVLPADDVEALHEEELHANFG